MEMGAWKIFRNVFVRGKVKACVIEAGQFKGMKVGKRSCVLTFGCMSDNSGGAGMPPTGIPPQTQAWLMKDGYVSEY
jgi:hypothetical protein